MFWDTIFDIGFFIWGLVDFINNPTWENAGWLALDALFLAIPFIPGVGKATKAVTKLDNVQDLSFIGRSNDFILLGQSMKSRVIPEALNLGVDWYKGFTHYDDIARISGRLANGVGYIDNMLFIAGKSLTGTRFLNMGFDAARIGQKGLWFSKFTIYSEIFVAQTFRLKNILRFYYSSI